MPTPRQRVVYNPIPTSFEILFIKALCVSALVYVMHLEHFSNSRDGGNPPESGVAGTSAPAVPDLTGSEIGVLPLFAEGVQW